MLGRTSRSAPAPTGGVMGLQEAAPRLKGFVWIEVDSVAVGARSYRWSNGFVGGRAEAEGVGMD